MVVKKKTTWNGKIQKVQVSEGKLVDEYGEIVELMDMLQQFYGDKVFDISISAKEEEDIEYEEVLED